MAVIKISEMTDAILLQDNDYVPILQNGLNKKVKVELLRDYDKLHNKPTINGVTVEHNKTITDYNVVKENQGIQINEDNKTLELETLGSIEIENRADVNKAITIKTADKTAKETAHQTMSKEYRPNDQAYLSEGENQPVSYKAVKEYVDTLETKVDENERDIEAKHTALEEKVDTNESDIESKHTTLNNKVDENERDIEDKVQKLDEKTAAKDSELENLISTNEEDIESKVQELDNKKLNKEETPKKLPNPYKLKFTGAVSGEYDGSEEKTINIPEGGSDYTLPQATENALGGIKAKAKTDETVEVAIDDITGKLFVPTYPEGGSGSSGGNEKEWKLLKTIKITEPVAQIFIDEDDDGNPINITDMMITTPLNVVCSGESQLIIQFNNKISTTFSTENSIVGPKTKSLYYKSWYEGVRVLLSAGSTYSFGSVASEIGKLRTSNNNDCKTITSIKIIVTSVGKNLTAGTFYIYGK